MPVTPPPVFEVAARIWVQSKLPTEGGGSGGGGALSPVLSYFNSPINTAGEVMKSALVLEEAISALRKKLPAERLPGLNDLRGGLRVDPVRDADILIIYYRNNYAYVGVEVVQAVLDAFLRVNSAQAAVSAKQSRIFLESQLLEYKTQMKELSEKVQVFKTSHGILDLEGETEQALDQISAIEQGIENTKIALAELNSRIEYLSSKSGVHPGQALRVEELSQDGLVFQLKQNIADGEGQYNELAMRLRPEHPRMRQLRRAIEQDKRRLTNRYRKLLGANEVAIESEADSSVEGVKARMLEQLIAALPERIVLETRIGLLQESLVQARKQLTSMPAEQVQLAELMRAEQIAIETVSETEKSLNQARLVEAVASKTSSYQIIDRPQVSGVTIASKLPKFASALVIGLVFAIAVFFGLDLLDPRMRRITPVLDTLPLPVIGWVSELVPADRVPELRESMHRLRLSIKGLLTGESNEIVIASADRGDGKSAIAAGLAMSFAESGMKVLLIDANLLEPTQHYVFNLPPSPGLADYLVNPVPDLWHKLMRPVGKNLKVITAGAGPAGVGLLATDAIREMMTIAKSEADVVIFDTPAITDSPAALALISPKTHLLSVVRMNHTLKQSLLILASQLRHHEFASGSMVIADVDEFALASALAKAGRREALELEE